MILDKCASNITNWIILGTFGAINELNIQETFEFSFYSFLKMVSSNAQVSQRRLQFEKDLSS